MITLIYGGSSSGKSEFAEDYISSLKNSNKFYLATMKASDTESIARIQRHRNLRKDKDFVTLEHDVDIKNSVSEIIKISDNNLHGTLESSAHGSSSILLECMSNLVANEMFREGKIISSEKCIEKISGDLKALYKTADDVVIVSNNIFEDGLKYDTVTNDYLNALGKINRIIANDADEVYEVVVGIPLKIK